jgi:hypothetical protein
MLPLPCLVVKVGIGIIMAILSVLPDWIAAEIVEA